MNVTEVTRENLPHIDFNSIVVFSYAEAGAMGEAGNLEFSSADGTVYHLNYLHGEISLGEFRRAYHAGSCETMPLPPCTWKPFWIGAGNHLLVHEVVLDKLMPEGYDDPDVVYQRWMAGIGTPLLSKEERYQWLVEKARAFYPIDGSSAEVTWCDACKEEINLWTYWQGRGCLAPEILVVGRDWGNPHTKEGEVLLESIYEGRPYLESSDSPTDIHLAKLFQKTFGLDLNRKSEQLFFTNLLLGYRTGNTSGKLNTPLGQDQALFKELVSILQPRVVICLGGETFDCALAAYGVSRPYTGNFSSALETGRTVADVGNIRFFGMGHCGNLGCLNRVGNKKGAGIDAGLEKQMEDWQRIQLYLKGGQ